jgi:hypothetical protein
MKSLEQSNSLETAADTMTAPTSTPVATPISRRGFVSSASVIAGGAAGFALATRGAFTSPAMAEVVIGLPGDTPAQTAEKAPAKIQPDVAAVAFLDSLSKEQRAVAHLSYDNMARVQWNFVPMTDRKGLPLKDMNADQRELAMLLLKSVVSDSGYRRSELIMQYEGVLREQEGPKSASRRDPAKYHFTIYGEPSKKSMWALSIEGHHLSLNFVFDQGKVIDSTPQFFGANPAIFQSDMLNRFEKGFQLLRDEEQLAWDLLNSLSKEHLAKAIIADKAPSEIDSPGSPQPTPTTLQGVPVAEMDESQKTTVLRLLRAYGESVPVEILDERMKLIKEAGIEKVHFSWSGASKPGVGHYYKVQGPTFLVEFINVQNDAIGTKANHIHCVWRDLQGDFNLPATS